MPMLHIVNKSPFERNTLNSCLSLCKDGASVLLIEDAVVAARSGSSYQHKIQEAMKKHTIYALGPDLEARAVPTDKILEGIKVVDYTGFVNLTVEHENLQSWL